MLAPAALHMDSSSSNRTHFREFITHRARNGQKLKVHPLGPNHFGVYACASRLRLRDNEVSSGSAPLHWLAGAAAIATIDEALSEYMRHFG